jgi:ATP-dependent RNA helicase RhlE
MALHGNKSQTARTQALAGFKSGDIRALVATDIAARGIDIDELPHVVNFEIPNVPEDYVHRIGRTGRAGNDGAAVSLVSLDEEGFMQEIERFTKQQIAVQVVDGFGPEPGEQAEPIAMGRQVLWGGKGRPPSRDVLNAAAKAARSEMMQRMRDNKEKSGEPARGRNGNGNGRSGGGQRGDGQQARNGNGNGQPRVQQPQQPRAPRQQVARNGNNGNGQQRPPRDAEPRQPRDTEERQPREGAHNSRSPFVVREVVQRSTDGQPDPLRTSVDSMARNGRRGGGGGGGGRSNRTGGGGYGARGPGNPARSSGR